MEIVTFLWKYFEKKKRNTTSKWIHFFKVNEISCQMCPVSIVQCIYLAYVGQMMSIDLGLNVRFVSKGIC